MSTLRMVLKWAALVGVALALAFLTGDIAFAQEATSPLADADPSLVKNINFENWELIGGFLTPVALEFLLKAKWSQKTKSAATFGFALALSVVGALLQDQFNAQDVVGSAMKIFVVTIPVYVGLVKHFGMKPSVGIN